MPVPGDRAGLKNRRSALDLDQNYYCGRDRHRRRRMHHDAQRAVVGIGVYLVHVRDLRHGQQCQQSQAHQGDQLQSTWPRAAFPAQKSLKSCQHTYPLLQEYTLIGCIQSQNGYVLRRGFIPANRPTLPLSIRLIPVDLHLERIAPFRG